jgi:hypothetical protein
MGYRGKLLEKGAARDLRASGWRLADIAAELGVSKSSVGLWVRDVAFEPRPRLPARRREPNALQRRKAAEIAALQDEGVARLGRLNEQAFLAAGAALYAGEGSKRDGSVIFANTDAQMMKWFCTWLRRFFAIDESRLSMRVYLHDGLDLEAAKKHWATVTDIPLTQFRASYRAKADSSIRTTKHPFGCAYVRYDCSRTHRAIMGLVKALLSSNCDNPG